MGSGPLPSLILIRGFMRTNLQDMENVGVLEIKVAVEQADEKQAVVVEAAEHLMGNAMTVEGYDIMLETVTVLVVGHTKSNLLSKNQRREKIFRG